MNRPGIPRTAACPAAAAPSAVRSIRTNRIGREKARGRTGSIRSGSARLLEQGGQVLRRFLWSLLAAAWAPPTVAFAENPRPRPNILFIAVDDLKPLLGCYGTGWIKSPNIDLLASKGALFLSNYCQVAFCAPSRFSVLTGMRPDSTGVYLNPDQPRDILRERFPEIATLPQHFKNHGYATHPLHKVFDGRTVDSGHDSASWTLPYGPWELAPGEKPAPGGYQNPATKAMLAEAAARGRRATGPATEACDIPDNAYHDGGVAATAAKRIRELAKKGQPFFLAVGFVKPHLPFVAPKKYWDLYDRTKLPLARFQSLPAGSPHDLGFYGHSGELREYGDILKSGPIPETTQRELLHGYAACVSYIDAQIGLLLETLRGEGVEGNTVVCVWGDHGWHLGEHGHWGKLTNYEDAARAPLLVASPGYPKGVRIGALTEFVDIYPTLCELAGLPLPSHVQGRSLVPLMRGEKVSPHEAAITQMGRGTGAGGLMGWSLRTERYRYTEWRRTELNADKPRFTNQIVSIELYDYQSDPLERENLASKTGCERLVEEQQDVFDRLLAHLPKRLR